MKIKKSIGTQNCQHLQMGSGIRKVKHYMNWWIGDCFVGHSSIIQVMSRKGIYVVDANDKAVTESVLIKSAPFDVVSLS